MKIRILSDLHLEFSKLELESAGEDLIVLAGDIHVGTAGAEWAITQSQRIGVPVIYVPGNHEYYKTRLTYTSFLELNETLRKIASKSDNRLIFLQNDVAIVDDTLIYGSTFWTDYNLYGIPERSMYLAEMGLNDHRNIMYTQNAKFMAEDALREHKKAMEFLENAILNQSFSKKIIITHHAPSRGSIHPRWDGDWLTPAFVSDKSEFIKKYKPDLWIHGHVHDSFDYMLDKTRIVCNPLGYPMGDGSYENGMNFRIDKLVEV